MRVFNQDKTIELKEYDLKLGHLEQDKLVTHIDAVNEQKEQGHYETVREYPNGGKDVAWVVDVPKVKPIEEHDEVEDILVYIPYTETELRDIAIKNYPNRVSELIRQRYSINDELAILRQRDEKPSEYKEYFAYCEECKTIVKNELGL